ncbi:MAG: hypothetical protein R3C56_33500 [Pirellulaceae bacterium]
MDTAYLQQDAFDPVDAATPMDRQRTMLMLLRDVTEREFMFESKEEARDFFVRITNTFRNLNFSPTDSTDYAKFLQNFQATLGSRARAIERPLMTGIHQENSATIVASSSVSRRPITVTIR